MKLTKEVVTVELKNGATAHGTLIAVDVHMNMHLKNVKWQAAGRDAVHLDAVAVRGNNVRCVLVGEGVPVDSLLVDDRPKRHATGAGAAGNVNKERARRQVPSRGGKMAIHRRK